MALSLKTLALAKCVEIDEEIKKLPKVFIDDLASDITYELLHHIISGGFSHLYCGRKVDVKTACHILFRMMECPSIDVVCERGVSYAPPALNSIYFNLQRVHILITRHHGVNSFRFSLSHDFSVFTYDTDVVWFNYMGMEKEKILKALHIIIAPR